jgi:hypothetical protein
VVPFADAGQEGVLQIHNATRRRSGQWITSKDLFPLAEIPVVRMYQDGDRELATCNWGASVLVQNVSGSPTSFAAIPRLDFSVSPNCASGLREC